MNQYSSVELLSMLNHPQIWDEKPVYCFTTDIDWASEAVISRFFKQIPFEKLKITAFVTHSSQCIEHLVAENKIDRGIHPFFLPGSSHGDNFKQIIETCRSFAPEAEVTRSHRLFNVSDTAHLLHENFGFNYSSNAIHTLSKDIKPYLHESMMIDLPIFWEEGTAMYNKLGLSINPFVQYFNSPGLKIISFHPMNIVFNTPEISWMRAIKDSLSREAFNDINDDTIDKQKNNNRGITNAVMEIINLVEQKNYPILSLKDIYRSIVK